MAARACHVCHYRSSVDDTNQPYLVSAPQSTRSPSACIVYLHDTLDAPTREGFLESAFQTAHHWKDALAQDDMGALFVQPMGRGNASWLGAAGQDLFDVLEVLHDEHSFDQRRVFLIGVGAGATGALQLAAWFPDRWAAIACCAPSVDDRLDHPSGSIPPWEEPARESMRTISLIRNLDTPIYLEHPLFHDGLSGSAHVDHFEALIKALHRSPCPLTVVREPALLPPKGLWPSDPAGVLQWLMAQPSNRSRTKEEHATFSPKSWRGCVRVERLEAPGKRATVQVLTTANEIRVKTAGAAALSIRLSDPLALRVDKNRFLKSDLLAARDPAGWMQFARLAESWTLWPSTNGSESGSRGKSSELPGPVCDMRWAGVAFVPGTLGDDDQNRTMRRLAEALRDAWTSGRDAPSPHSGDRTTRVDYPIVPDGDVSEDLLAKRHLVVLGTPKTNLLLARYQARVGCTWPSSSQDKSIEPFRVAGKLYNGPRDGLFLLGPNPDCPDRYLLVVTATTSAALARAILFPTAYMPDYLVYRDNTVRAWGHCKADWKP